MGKLTSEFEDSTENTFVPASPNPILAQLATWEKAGIIGPMPFELGLYPPTNVNDFIGLPHNNHVMLPAHTELDRVTGVDHLTIITSNMALSYAAIDDYTEKRAWISNNFPDVISILKAKGIELHEHPTDTATEEEAIDLIYSAMEHFSGNEDEEALTTPATFSINSVAGEKTGRESVALMYMPMTGSRAKELYDRVYFPDFLYDLFGTPEPDAYDHIKFSPSREEILFHVTSHEAMHARGHGDIENYFLQVREMLAPTLENDPHALRNLEELLDVAQETECDLTAVKFEKALNVSPEMQTSLMAGRCFYMTQHAVHKKLETKGSRYSLPFEEHDSWAFEMEYMRSGQAPPFFQTLSTLDDFYDKTARRFLQENEKQYSWHDFSTWGTLPDMNEIIDAVRLNLAEGVYTGEEMQVAQDFMTNMQTLNYIPATQPGALFDQFFSERGKQIEQIENEMKEKTEQRRRRNRGNTP